MGNPSDMYFGKTISLSIKNFWAEVTIFESAKICLTPHPLCDPTEFGSLADLHDSYGRDGYLGGLRLLQATCKKFYHYCSEHGIALGKRNFTMKYETNIPRQVRLLQKMVGISKFYMFSGWFGWQLGDRHRSAQVFDGIFQPDRGRSSQSDPTSIHHGRRERRTTYQCRPPRSCRSGFATFFCFLEIPHTRTRLRFKANYLRRIG